MNKLVKDALVLTAITLIAGVCLGGVYEITKDPIAKAQESATQESYKAVFADAASFEDLEGFDADAATKIAADAGYTDDDITNCVVAKDDAGQAIGYVITITSHAGYGGDITFSMGVTNDGTLNGYSITDISETAGLGMKAKEDGFMSQFAGIPAGRSWKLPSLARQPIQRSKPSVVQRSHLRQLPMVSMLVLLITTAL